MAIGTANRNDYTGTGLLDTYAFTFKIFDEDDLLVTMRDDDGNETNPSFTVDGVGVPTGGTITLNAGDLASGYHLTIRRRVALSQSTDFKNQSSFFPKVHEDQFDYLTMIGQQLQDQLNRTLRFAESIPGSAAAVEIPAVPNGILALDSNGTALTTVSVEDLVSIAMSASQLSPSLAINYTAGQAYASFTLRGAPTVIGTISSEFSFYSFYSLTDTKVAKIVIRPEPYQAAPLDPVSVLPDCGVYTLYVKNTGFGMSRAFTTDGNTFFFGTNPSDGNCAAGAVIQRNATGYYAASALVPEPGLDAAGKQALFDAGYIDSTTLMSNIFLIGLGSDDWIGIGKSTGAALAQGVEVQMGAGHLALQCSAVIATGGYLGFSATTAKSGTVDSRLRRLASGNLLLYGTTVRQVLSITGTYTSDVNFEALNIGGNATGPFQILTATTGGTYRALHIGTGGGTADMIFITNNVARLAIDGTSGALTPQAATIDLGKQASPFRTAYFSQQINIAETASAPTGIANNVVVFAQDNGGGKTQLMAQMPTGVAQQILIEA